MQIEPLDTREKVRDAIRVHGHGWQEAYDGLVPDEVLASLTVDPSPEDVDRWLDRLPDEGGVALGAVVDGGVRGYINLLWEGTKPFVGPDEAGLKEIYVHPDWWGEGVGTALFEAGCTRLPDDVAAIALEMLATNDVGRQFYEARGFEVDDHDTYEIAGEPYETDILRREV
jgi:GNAT superfamily N-acetyltransferase